MLLIASRQGLFILTKVVLYRLSHNRMILFLFAKPIKKVSGFVKPDTLYYMAAVLSIFF